ncbi:MAG: VOC family protein [Chloroflexota bacterium]|nr:VOC family protein [Chloroflexota bacterium]
MFDAVHHIAYVVPDREAALALYQEKLGMTPFKIWESEEEGNAYAALQIGDTDSYLEIICPTDDEVSKFAAHLHEHGPSVHHVAFRDDAMDDTLATLSGEFGIGGTDPIVSSSDWRISFLDTDKTLGVGLQLVDGRHL